MDKSHTSELIHSKLLNWFMLERRDFPWREYSDPYRIMIAEFMLHRTKADQVVPVYIDFLKKYSTVKSLAEANKNDIIKVTEHLGLHWRSGHFITAAQYVKEHFNGEFPDNREDLLKIPGVGDYVAGAILTVCFNKPEHVVDSNIARFINRFYGLKLRGEIRRKRQIVEISRELFQNEEPGTFLFAILDFTYKICKSQTPLCESCILSNACKYQVSAII